MLNITQNLRRIITLFFSFLIVVVMSIFYLVGEKKAYETIEEEASAAMLKTVLQVAQSIDYQIKTKFAILESIANSHFMNDSNQSFSLDEKLHTLELEYQRLSKLEFKRFGILDTQGIAHYTNGRTLFLGDQEHFKKALKGENAISKVLISQYEKAPIFAYTTPIRHSQTNEVSGVLFAAMDAQRLSQIASSIAYGKSGYAIILDKNGQIIGHKEFSKVLNSLNVLDQSHSFSPTFRDTVFKMTQGLVGKEKFFDNDQEWSVAYAPIPIVGWSIAILAPNNEINERASHLTYFLLMVSLFILAIALVFSYILAYYITRYQEKLEREKSEKTKELLLAHNEYEKIFENNAAGIYVVDENRTILSANERTCEIFGYTKEEIIGQNFLFLHVNQNDYENFANHYICIEDNLKINIEYQFKRKDETIIWCQLLGTSMVSKSHKKGIVWSILDITERKTIEQHNKHLKELYAMLSQCNQAIVYCKNESELFHQICQDTVKFGEMKMAWIGRGDFEKRTIKPIAVNENGIGYIENLSISMDEDTGPAGIALREDHPVWVQDLIHDIPQTMPWYTRAKNFGWRAVAALPLHKNGTTFGVFALYSDQVNIFTDDIKELLLEMVGDIDYALESYQKEAKLNQLIQAVEQTPTSIVITDLESNIVYANEAFAKVTGYTLEEAMGKNPRILKSDKTPESFYTQMWSHLTKGSSWKGEFTNKRKDGSEYIESVNISPVMGNDGTIINYMAIKEDITAKKEAEEKIHQLANFDHLTGLPNRVPLYDYFKYVLNLAKRNNQAFAIMFLDLDHFKEINDTLGHNVGDTLLIEVSLRLRSLMREVDMITRLGGDEFIIIMPETPMLGAEQVSKKLLEVISTPYYIDSHELNITVSIGIALYPFDGLDFETLSKNADTAMYQAKAKGRNQYCFFTEDMQTKSLYNLQLSNALRHAIERNELVVYYQPQISLEDGRIIGAEALLRWFHPELGAISPSVFIPIAEESGQILAIGEWVLRTTAQQAQKWVEDGFKEMVFSVNLSAYQFRHPSLPKLVTQILVETGLSSEHLELELTESMAMHDPLEAIKIMDNLHKRGIRLSIDDFGTGYSSLSYLKKFKIYKLKIDQSFVRDIDSDTDDRAIVKAIIMIARSLGMVTIAEGVETAEQLAFLQEQGCEEAQGYYYSKPLSASRFEEFIKNH